MRQLLVCIFALVVGLTALPNAENSLNQPMKLTGRVTDGTSPVVGATVFLSHGDSMIASSPTGNDGRFELTGRLDYGKPLLLTVSSVGYQITRIPVTPGPAVTLPDILLKEQILEVQSLKVTGSIDNSSLTRTIDSGEIVHRAEESFVPTNPIAAIKRPEIVRQGSNHSSQIRIDGAAPEFQIDGASVGADPDHYGMFAVLPTPAVGRISLQSRGTPACYEAPAIVELTPPRAYARPLSGELNVSVIEATGAVAYGTEDHYALATVRKSILDQLVNKINLRAGRRTIPPAGFTDLFLSVGRRFDDHSEIVLNQYHSGDRLVFNTGPTKASPGGIDTFQDTEEHFVSGKCSGSRGNLRFKMTGDVHLRDENYMASSPSQPSSLDIDLKERSSEIGAGIEAAYDWQGHVIDAGFQTQAVVGRHTTLLQKNWNFLPPDANSDAPNPYQEELNAAYGNIANDQTSIDNAAFVSLKNELGPFSFENGVRLQTFSHLARSSDLVQRHRIVYNLSHDSRLAFFVGSFSENPISRVLEPYQVLIRLDAEQLLPIHTRMIAVSGIHRSFSIECFARRANDLPVLQPDFSAAYPAELPQSMADSGLSGSSPPMLAMHSSGAVTTYGLEFALSPVQLPGSRFTVTANYALTHASLVTPFGSFPTDLDAPHRLYARLEFASSQRLTLGSEFALRSGYPYTPYPSRASTAASRYSVGDYEDRTAEFNSRRFPLNYQINVSARYTFGHSELFLTVANVSNHGNPLINTNNGYIYDAGILPSLGYRLTF